jgi:plastocyanin
MSRRMQRRAMCATVLAAALPRAARAAAGAAQVYIDNFAFSPAALTVDAGSRVAWTNRDDIPHTVTGSATTRVMRSPPLDTGDTYEVTFESPGVFEYFCALHPHMRGSVTVR